MFYASPLKQKTSYHSILQSYFIKLEILIIVKYRNTIWFVETNI